jgi:hypothetical protein
VVGGPRDGRLQFTPAEDTALRDWVRQHASLASQGQRLWKMAERARVTRHTWQSMHNRWRRHLKRGSPKSELCRKPAPAPEERNPGTRLVSVSTARGLSSTSHASASRDGAMHDPLANGATKAVATAHHGAVHASRRHSPSSAVIRNRDATASAASVPANATPQQPHVPPVATPNAAAASTTERLAPAAAQASPRQFKTVPAEVLDEVDALQLPAWLRTKEARKPVDWEDL